MFAMPTVYIRPDFSGEWLFIVATESLIHEAVRMPHTSDYIDRVNDYLARASTRFELGDPPDPVRVDSTSSHAALVSAAVSSLGFPAKVTAWADHDAFIEKALAVATMMAAADPEIEVSLEEPDPEAEEPWTPLAMPAHSVIREGEPVAPEVIREPAPQPVMTRPVMLAQPAPVAPKTPQPQRPGKLETALREAAALHAEEIRDLFGADPSKADLEQLVLWALTLPERGAEVLQRGFAGSLLRRVAVHDVNIVTEHGGRAVSSLSDEEIALYMAEQRGAGKLSDEATRAYDLYRQSLRR